MVYTTNRQSITWNTSWSVLSIPLNSFHLPHLFLWSLLNCLGLRGKTCDWTSLWSVTFKRANRIWHKVEYSNICSSSLRLTEQTCKCVAVTLICFAAAALLHFLFSCLSTTLVGSLFTIKGELIYQAVWIGRHG